MEKMSDKGKTVEHQNDTVKKHQKQLPFLPDEIIFQILLWLPVKFLLQLKCVSKSWKTLISNPKFAKTHLQSITVNPTITDQRLFFSDGIGKPTKLVSFDVKQLLENSSEPTKPVEFIREHRLESDKSPTLDYSYRKCMWITYYGFGYDHVNDKYKVLVVLGRRKGSDEKVTKVYTFGGNSWKTIQNFPCSARGDGKFVSGTLNWVVKKDDSFNEGDYQIFEWKTIHNFPCSSVILSFDVEKETYNEVLLPYHDAVIFVCDPSLGVLSNCLCVCFDFNKTHWDFWLMKKYGAVESWTRLMMIPRARIQHCLQVQYPPRYVEPLFIFENVARCCEAGTVAVAGLIEELRIGF
ncbi:hypothetical protein TSUD_173760 [Trifolium subterraneum]|nr:hypothetical protein TSUD_173760 [Trifolium subterraneum]